MTETPLPPSHQGVGRRPPGAEPALCEPVARRGGGRARLDLFGGPARPPPTPPATAHLDLGRALTIFWGSHEPGAGRLFPMGTAPVP